MIGVFIGIGIIGLIVGLFAYSYSQIHLQLSDISLAGIDWAPASGTTLFNLAASALTGDTLGAALALIDGVKFNFLFDAGNRGIFPVAIPSISYDLSINGLNVGKGEGHFDTILNPGETKILPVEQTIQKGNIQMAAASVVAEGGVMTIKASGTAQFGLFGITVPVPFESSREISIIDEVKKRFSGGDSNEVSTFLSLTTSSRSVAEGEQVTLTGRLTTETGESVSNAMIQIKDEDLGSGDDALGSVMTRADGRFTFEWFAEPGDPFDDVSEVYAFYEGSADLSSSRSEQIDITVTEQLPSTPAPQGFQSTSITLQVATTAPSEDYAVLISGYLLTASGEGVPGATIYLKDEDLGSGDDDIALVYTNSDGYYSYSWSARPMDPFDNVAEIYSVFEGDANFGSARSVQINVTVN